MRTLVCILIFAGALCALSACKERRVEVGAPTAHLLSESIGNGPLAKDGRLVTIRYKLTTEDGATTMLESDSYRFEVGANSVIGAVDDAVRNMRVGGRRVVECPPETHWGRGGYGGKIPPNTTLRLDVELLAVK